MVSWGYTFKRRLIILLWTTVWCCIGGSFAFIIIRGSLLDYLLNPSRGLDASAVLGVIAGIVIGALMALLGGFEAIVKIMPARKPS